MSDMTGGSSVDSSLTLPGGKVFDLREEKDVVVLLRHIHKSPLEPAVKNLLRDTVFEFRAQADAVVTDELISMFSEHDFSLSKKPSSEKLVDKASVSSLISSVNKMGVTRPQPVFGSSSAVVISVPTTQVETPKKSVTDTDIVTQSDPEISTQKPVEEVKAVVTPPSVKVLDPIVPKADLPKKDAIEQKSTPPAVAAPAVSTPIAPAQTSTPVPAVDVTVRIKEIKKQVNQMVGNPVKLIDSHNEIGREYMNALLDAMKKSAGGSPQEVVQAMKRLEESFTTVKTAIESQKKVTSPPQEPPAQETETALPSELSKVDDNPTIEPVATGLSPIAGLVPEEKPVAQESITAVNAQDTSELSKTSEVPDIKEDVKPAVPPPAQKENKEVSENISKNAEIKLEAKTEEVAMPSATAENFANKKPASAIKSVAKEKQVQDMMVAKKLDDATTDQQKKAAEIATMNPLMTPEVTNGLNQLLTEWDLFKHSGLFGTGPHGHEHPLYLKLSSLTMAAVVAGRFEGVTPQIKRSVSDYMNGWRYEEGILHEQGETFDQYLRRVIKHILDKRSVSKDGSSLKS